jgi:predicted acetyltransferase
VTVVVRQISGQEFRPWLEAIHVAYGEELADETAEALRKVLVDERCLAAFDGDQIVGGAAAYDYALTVPGGGAVPTAGVTLVGVKPTHRRRGILRQMMARQLADARAAGDALAILYASEGVIYQRFGYGLATLNGSIDIKRANAGFRQRPTSSATLRLVDAAEAGRTFPPVYDEVAAEVPGFFSRSRAWWQAMILPDPASWRRGASPKYFCLHERDGVPSGYAIYRVKEGWGEHGPQSELRVLEAHGVDADAVREVWQFLFGVDLIDRITRRSGPPDPPLLLQLELPGLLGLRIADGLWLRVLDVRRALETRSFAADGDLRIEVNDEFLPDAGGRWLIRVVGGRAVVEPTTDRPDLELEPNDLAAVYLGEFSFAALAAAGRTREFTPGARERADRLFATGRRPWCPQVF